MLLGFLVACGENTQSVIPAHPDTPPPSAPYGLIADISFEGDLSQFSHNAKIVVFMRKANARMPLAVEQFKVSDLPKLVSFASVMQDADIELVTRLSPSGKIQKSANDIETITTVGMLEHPPKTYYINLVAGLESVEGEINPVATNIDEIIQLRVRVSVSPTAVVPRDTRLRIIVQGDDESWPIATKSLMLDELPVVLTFTDLDATSLNQTLSSSKKLTISVMSYQTEAGKAQGRRESIEVDTANIPDLVLLEIGG